MVDFENICVKDGVLTANAVNVRYGIKEHITAKIDGSYLIMKLLKLLGELFLKHKRIKNIQVKQQ